MILWVDDLRQPPGKGYYWVKSVNDAIAAIRTHDFEYLDLDHDAGDYYEKGGDYIIILDWLEHYNKEYPIRLHTMNPVGLANMRRIIKKNHWQEIHK